MPREKDSNTQQRTPGTPQEFAKDKVMRSGGFDEARVWGYEVLRLGSYKVMRF